MTPTLFSWGYYGWGNHTPEFIAEVDAVEQARGFQPPVFVDVRIRRSVRAVGFNGTAFEKLLGPQRHHWMKSLGNEHVVSRTGPLIQIVDPEAVNPLLDLVFECAKQRRRILYFCGCQWPRCDGKEICHRARVADLCLAAAKRRKQPINLVEWPGGEAIQYEFTVRAEDLAAIARGRGSVVLPEPVDLAEVGSIPWASLATFHAEGHSLQRLIGPAQYHKGHWSLPLFPEGSNAATLRSHFGLELGRC